MILNENLFETLNEEIFIKPTDNGYHDVWYLDDRYAVHNDGGRFHVIDMANGNNYLLNSDSIDEVNNYIRDELELNVVIEPSMRVFKKRAKVGGKEVAKQAFLKELANLDYDVGHTYDPDDFSYFQKSCKEDGWNVTEDDFAKYFEYLDEIRSEANSQYDDEVDLGNWEEMYSKQVKDSDGFMTDYTWYVKDNEDGSETHVMIFGDQDLYTPMNSEPDAEFDNESAAEEWFDNYTGLDDLDEALDTDDSIAWNSLTEDDLEDFGIVPINTYENPEYYCVDTGLGQQVVVAQDEDGKITIEEDTDGLGFTEGKEFESEDAFLAEYDKRINGQLDESLLNEEQDVSDNLTTEKTLSKSSDQLGESCAGSKTNCLNENVENIVDQYDIASIKLNNGQVLDKDEYFIIKADDKELYEVASYTYSIHVIERFKSEKEATDYLESIVNKKVTNESIKPNIESEELQALAKKHNIKILDAMNNGDLRMEGAGADLMKFYQEASEKGLWQVSSDLYEALYGFDEINRFMKKAQEIGLNTLGDVDNFLKQIKQPGESEMQALDRYRKELGYSFSKADKYYDIVPKQFREIADRCGLKVSEYDEFIENELVKQNIPVTNDNLIKAIKKYEVELDEAVMSDIDIEIQEAGGKDSWKQKALEQLAEMESSLSYLKNYVPKYINAGSNYDSVEELDADIAELEKDITKLKAKISLVK